MGIFETFTKQEEKRNKAKQIEVYQYDNLPEAFRVQVIQIWREAIGPYKITTRYGPDLPAPMRLWQDIHDTLAHEKGKFNLGNMRENPDIQCQQYLLQADTNDALDLIHISFYAIDKIVRNLHYIDKEACNITQHADDAIAELNYRFREHGIGYQFDEGNLIRQDSQYIHDQVVKPAISLLHDVNFQGAEDEFMHAHEHYRKGRYKEAIIDALKSFESTMKAICKARNWSYSSNDTSNQLIKIMFDQGLIPQMLQDHFAGLRSLLIGLPTVRNKTSGHGQGVTPIEVPAHMANYVLNMAASDIVFLVESHKATE